MTRTLEQKLAALRPMRRQKVRARTSELIANEQSRRALRRALALTREKLAKELGISQASVSRVEKRSDLLISTLRACVEAIGGKLHLVVEFPQRPPISLSGLAAIAAGISTGFRGEGAKSVLKGQSRRRSRN